MLEFQHSVLCFSVLDLEFGVSDLKFWNLGL